MRSFIFYLEAGEEELTNYKICCVVPFAIAELGQRCLEATPILKFESINSCIIVLNV